MLSGKAKNVLKLSQLSSQFFTALGYLLDYFSFNDSKLSISTSSLTALYIPFKLPTKAFLSLNLIWCKIRLCILANGNVAPIASFKPFKPSTQKISTF